jgi:uncharacterized membrane protein
MAERPLDKKTILISCVHFDIIIAVIIIVIGIITGAYSESSSISDALM